MGEGGRRKKTLWTREGGARNVVGEGKGGARNHSAGEGKGGEGVNLGRGEMRREEKTLWAR